MNTQNCGYSAKCEIKVVATDAPRLMATCKCGCLLEITQMAQYRRQKKLAAMTR